MHDQQALDPAVRELLDLQASRAPDVTHMSDAERVTTARESLLQALRERDSIYGLPNQVQTRDLTLENGSGGRPARLYTPPGGVAGPKPLLIYLHGGGWVAGSLATVEPFCCLLAATADLLILSVDYRQPPEHRSPAALDDAVAAVRWAAEHATELGADPARLALGGDSAGGHLAAAAANRLGADSSAPRLHAQLLLFPVTDHPSAKHPSFEQNATGFGLTAEMMQWFWNQYAPDSDPGNPDLSPLRNPSLPELPSTLVVTAEFDVLRDEGRAYADKLRDANVAVTHLHAPDMHHDFPVSPASVGRFPQSVSMLSQIAGWLRAALGTPLPATRKAQAQAQNNDKSA